jgi:alpha-galactosidase
MLKLRCAFIALVPFLYAAATDISGTWVAQMTTPMGEMEIVYRLKVDRSGNITGTQSLPFGDAPIISGQVTGDNFEFTVEVDAFGDIQKKKVKGKIVGDELQLVPAMPGPPPDSGPAMSGGPTRLISPITARRGTPSPSHGVTIDYTSLPQVELPALKDIAPTGQAPTPPMGWNSWNKFRTKIDDQTVREIADAMVKSGLKDAGYVYVIIDDGWQSKRDDSGVLQPNPQFPDMKALAAYVHSKGLKLGIYSSAGQQTCGGFVGSCGHEDIDAKTWPNGAWTISNTTGAVRPAFGKTRTCAPCINGWAMPFRKPDGRLCWRHASTGVRGCPSGVRKWVVVCGAQRAKSRISGHP